MSVEEELSKHMLEIFHSPNNHTKFVIPQLPKDQWDNSAKMVMILIEEGVLQFAPPSDGQEEVKPDLVDTWRNLGVLSSAKPMQPETNRPDFDFVDEWCRLFGRKS